MELPRIGDMGRRNARLMTDLLRQKDGAVGEAQGTNAGGISAQQGPFGQVIQQDSFRTTGFDLYVVIVKYGPDGTTQYTDDRYWAREVYFKQEASTGPLDAASLWISVNGFWGVVRNMGENVAVTHTLYEIETGTITEDRIIPEKQAVFAHIKVVDGLSPDEGEQLFTFVPGGANTCISFLVTSDTTPGTAYRRYNGKSIVKGVVNATEDLIIENGAEPISIFSSNQLLVSPNTGAFGVEACGQVNDVDEGTGNRIVISWIGFASCEGAAPPASDGAI